MKPNESLDKGSSNPCVFEPAVETLGASCGLVDERFFFVLVSLRAVLFLLSVLVDLAAGMFQLLKIKTKAPKPSAGHSVQTGDGALNR